MKQKSRETLRLITDYSAGTLELGLSVAVGAGIGYVLDHVVFDGRTAPWLTLFWLLCGVFAGFRSLLRVVRKLERAESKGDADDDPV